MDLHINKFNGAKHKTVKKKKLKKNVQWQPVSNIPVDEIYRNLPEAKEFHESYVNMWLKEKSR